MLKFLLKSESNVKNARSISDCVHPYNFRTVHATRQPNIRMRWLSKNGMANRSPQFITFLRGKMFAKFHTHNVS